MPKCSDIQKKLKELDQLKAAQEHNQAAVDNATNIMKNLYDQGLLKQTNVPGQVIMVESYEEFQQQRE